MKKTLGQIRTTKGFNPSGNDLVDKIKERMSNFIDDIEYISKSDKYKNNGEAQRQFSLAITYAEHAQEKAVKGLFIECRE